MVEQLELADHNVKFIAELIDLLLMNLVPRWKPCVDISHLTSANCEKPIAQQEVSGLEKRKQILEGSSQNVAEVVGLSDSHGGSATKQDHDHFNFDEALFHASVDIRSVAKTYDSCSEISYASATSDSNDKKSSLVSYVSADSTFADFYLSRERGPSEVSFASIIGESPDHFGSKTSDLGSHDMLNFSINPRSVSSLSDLEDKLRIELDMIEQKYHEAIKEISKRRNQAIMETRRRLSQKKIQS